MSCLPLLSCLCLDRPLTLKWAFSSWIFCGFLHSSGCSACTRQQCSSCAALRSFSLAHSAFAIALKAYLPSQKDIIDAHQGRFAPLLHLVNQGQLAVEVFFILSGFLFYKSAISADLTQPPAASRCAHFVISRCLRLWPIMIFCSILLLPSPMVPNRAAAAWTLLFASNHLPWNRQFLSWLWFDFLCTCARDLPNLTCTSGLSASMCNILLSQLLPCTCPNLPPLERQHFWQFWQYLSLLLLLRCPSKPPLSSSPHQPRPRCLYPCLSSALTG